MKPSRGTIRVAVVDDRPEDRDRIARLFANSTEFTCAAVCASGEEALAVLPSCAPDVVLMDIQMGRMSGIACARQLKPKLPNCEIMMLTVVEDHERIFQSLAAGATGYMLKKTPPVRLLEAVGELASGGAPMSGQIARQVVAAFQKAPHQADEPLSPIEQRVLTGLARGLLYKEVAEKLGVATSTVRTHIWHIYRKLHVHNRTEAVLKAQQQQLQ